MDAEGIPYPPTHPKGPRAQVITCRATGHGPGCGHPVDWHVGQGTPAPDCDCCSWRKNDPEVLVQGPAAAEPARTPAPAGYSAEKWATMNRKERRAALRGRRTR